MYPDPHDITYICNCSSGSPDYARPNIGASFPPPPPPPAAKHPSYEPVVSYTRAIPTRNEESAARTAKKVSNTSTLQIRAPH